MVSPPHRHLNNSHSPVSRCSGCSMHRGHSDLCSIDHGKEAEQLRRRFHQFRVHRVDRSARLHVQGNAILKALSPTLSVGSGSNCGCGNSNAADLPGAMPKHSRQGCNIYLSAQGVQQRRYLVHAGQVIIDGSFKSTDGRDWRACGRQQQRGG